MFFNEKDNVDKGNYAGNKHVSLGTEVYMCCL